MKQKNGKWIIAFGIMVLLQLICLIHNFTLKEGTHSDELWSYGYANHYYGGDLGWDEDDNPIHCEEWIDSSLFRDYLMVHEDERFAYDSVYSNMKDGEHPPLHSMILHTICSLFPDTFSLWYSFSINVVAFLICMVYLFKLCCLLKDDWFAFWCCGLYGFSMAARDTFIYLRMYAMCTMLLVVLIYNMLAYLKQNREDGKLFDSHLVIMIIVAFLAFTSHFYMVAATGIITALICAYLLWKKRVRVMLTLGLSMVASLCGLLVAFPPTLTRVYEVIDTRSNFGSRTTTVDWPLDIKYKILANFFLYKLFNFSVSIYPTAVWKITLGILLFTVILMIPVLFLLRNTNAVCRVRKRIRFTVRHGRQIVGYLFRRIRWEYVLLFFTIVMQLVLVGETTWVYGMSIYEDRYFCYLYPLIAIVVLLFLDWVLKLLLKKKIQKIVTAVIVCGILVMNIKNQRIEKSYFFETKTEGTTMAESVEGKDVVCIMEPSWFLIALSSSLMDSNSFFMVSSENYQQYAEEYLTPMLNQSMVITVNLNDITSADEKIQDLMKGVYVDAEKMGVASNTKKDEILRYFESLAPGYKAKKVSSQVVYGRCYETYELVKLPDNYEAKE